MLFCDSLPSVVRHPSLASLRFGSAHPAPECALMVLQLSQALKQLGRVNMLRCLYGGEWACLGVQDAQAAFTRFQAALQACGLWHAVG